MTHRDPSKCAPRTCCCAIQTNHTSECS